MAPNNFSRFSSICVEFFCPSIGRLSNGDGDVNEDGKKTIGLDWQRNNFARTSRFFVHFFAVVATTTT